MLWLSLIGLGSFLVASLVVGGRLLWRARHARQLPDVTIGLTLFLGPIGYALLTAASEGAVAEAARRGVLEAGLQLTTVADFSLVVFVWRVFRRPDPWAPSLVGGIGLLLLASFVFRLGQPAPPLPAASFWPGIVGSLLGYAWCSSESLRYWRRMRRRVGLHLADPEVTRRFALWGVASGMPVLINLGDMLRHVASPVGTPAEILVGVQSALGLVAAVCVWLAFFPARRGARRAAPAAF